jgi:hypothetical protein
LARFAVKTTYDDFGIGRPRARRNAHRAAHIKAPREFSAMGRSSAYDPPTAASH